MNCLLADVLNLGKPGLVRDANPVFAVLPLLETDFLIRLPGVRGDGIIGDVVV